MNKPLELLLVGAVAFVLGAVAGMTIAAPRTETSTVSAAPKARGGGSLITAFCEAPQSGAITYSPGTASVSSDINFAIPIPGDGKLTSLAVNPYANTLSDSTIVTLLVNGADTALAITIPPVSTAVQIVTVNVPVAAGDLVTLKTDTQLSNSGKSDCFATYEYKRK